MPKLDLDAIPQTNATGYPPPYDEDVAGRHYRRLAPVGGLTKLGASHVVLEPGAYSSQRHWHEGQDELVVILQGEAILIEDAGEFPVGPGDILAWPAGEKNGHRLHNRSDKPCVFLAISGGDRELDRGEYPDIDMVFTPDGYFRKDGTPYPTKRVP
ncbi:cupin domain-containing protein [Qipengyuania sp. 1NDH17]|uniref:Cupin domain-containing protein n=1 Tax=Qipengyuania polymorpha TaxID=2867234 RepID=A0ABS7IXR2_9SPHN|nr:cupin domain-containing protein [Qipengyuania polymorpha]MBX7458358.1 cupin domain-containing protein [Qipengyuania polymorpha]